MGFNKTFFPHFNSFCTDKFGYDTGELIFTGAEEKLLALMKDVDYRSSKYIRWHMDKNMLPAIAIYQTFKQFDSTCEKAYEYTDEVLQIFRLKNQKRNEWIGKLPFGYSAFKLFCRSVISKQYPKQGWDIQWVQSNEKEVCFHMKSCIYVETTQKNGCPEMCSLFCKNDDIVLAGYRPAIIFERNETIAYGNNKCDFHFKNAKNII